MRYLLWKSAVTFALFGFWLTAIHASAIPAASRDSAASQFSVQDELGLRSFTWQESPALSPDGRYIVYLISYLGPESRDEGKHQELWLVDVKTKQTTLITAEAPHCSKPTWSPDGSRVAYYDQVGDDTVIRIWSLDSKNSKLLASNIEHGELLPWSPDGKFIYARRISKPSTQTTAEAKSGEAKPDDPAAKDGIIEYRSKENQDKEATDTWKDKESSILAFDTASGAEKTIVHRKKMGFFALSPNGHFIAWAENERFFSKPEFYRLTDVGIVTLSTGEARIVAHDFKDLFDVYGNGLTWCPDGNTLGIASRPLKAAGHSATYFAVDARSGSMRPVFTSNHPQDDATSSILNWLNERQFLIKDGGPGRELWVISTDGGKPYRIYELSSGSIRGLVLGASRWDLWQPKPHTLVALVRRDSDLKIVPVLINYETGSATELSAMARFIWPAVWLPHGVDSGSAALILEDPTQPQNLWSMSADGSLDQLTHINPGIEARKFGSVRLLEWQENGQRRRAVLLLPPDYVAGKRYPTIVSEYPGLPWSTGMYRFGMIADNFNEVYASRGYAVLQPDIYQPLAPGNEGDGSYASERPNKLEAIARQINAAVDYAVKEGYVDPERLGITGTSNGGYGAMCTIVSTTRFKAAIARATVVDEISDSWQFDEGRGLWGPLYEKWLGASVWKDRDLYIQDSPYYFLDRVQTPLLLTRGTKDDTVTTQPEQAYIGMKLLGKDVTLVEYEGEGHIDGEWSYSHRRDLLERMLRFFDEHLKAAAVTTAQSASH